MSEKLSRRFINWRKKTFPVPEIPAKYKHHILYDSDMGYRHARDWLEGGEKVPSLQGEYCACGATLSISFESEIDQLLVKLVGPS